MKFKNILYVFSIMVACSASAMDRKTFLIKELGQLQNHINTVFNVPSPDTMCTICQEKQEDNSDKKLWTNLEPCNHYFHVPCIGQFGAEAAETVATKCPNCKQEYSLAEGLREFFTPETKTGLIERGFLPAITYKEKTMQWWNLLVKKSKSPQFLIPLGALLAFCISSEFVTWSMPKIIPLLITMSECDKIWAYKLISPLCLGIYTVMILRDAQMRNEYPLSARLKTCLAFTLYHFCRFPDSRQAILNLFKIGLNAIRRPAH